MPYMTHQHLYLGITNPKSPGNMGSILRAAGCFGANKIFYTGQRYELARKYATDTKGAGQRIPQVHCEAFSAVCPPGVTKIAVELVEGATPLPEFMHPEHAFYLFGPEDGSLSQVTIDDCDDVVYLPTTGCLNLAATVNILLYDRMAKATKTEYGDHIIKGSRDRNNTTRYVRKNKSNPS